MTYYFYRVKRLIRNKRMFFWAILFPIVLATFFKMAFGEIATKNWAFQTIEIVVVNGENASEELVDFYRDLMNGDKPFFGVKVTTQEEAEQLLRSGEVKAIIQNEATPKLIFLENGLSETIVKTVTDSYLQSYELLMRAAMEGTFSSAMEEFSRELSVVTKKEYEGGSKDPMILYFQALLAMASLYGAMYGVVNTQELNMEFGAIAARRLVAPMRPVATVLADTAAAFTAQYAQFLLLLGYYLLILRLDFGEINGWIFVVGALHSLTGVLYGYLIGSIVRKGDALQESVMMATVMLSCFLSGLMISQMREIMEMKCPIVNRINPATLMADCYHSLCVVKDQERFTRCMLTLLLECVLFLVGSVLAHVIYDRRSGRSMEKEVSA